MKKPTCTFSYGGLAIQCARRFFHSYLKETKKINNQFLSISVISGRWKCEDERLCSMKHHFGSERISPPAGFEPEIL